MKKSVVVFLVIGLYSVPALAEELYEFSCCPTDDCQSAEVDVITITPNGYHIDSLNVVIEASDPRVRASRDGQYHICTRSSATPNMSQTSTYAFGESRTIKCLYVPVMS